MLQVVAGLAKQNASNVALIGTAVIVAGGIGWYGLSSGAGASGSQPPARETAGPSAASAPRDPSEPGADAPRVRKLESRERRDQLLRAIRSAQQQRAAALAAKSTTAAPAPSPALPRGASPTRTIDNDSSDLDEEYVRNSVKALVPMLVDCYTEALDAQPGLAGRLVVNFTIEGAPDIGGLVTESSIDAAQSEIQDPGMRQCVEETMYALEIDPPSGGGTVKVTYPFEFRPKE